MGWRRDEVWLDTDLLWFREEPRRRFGALAVSVPAFAAEPPPFLPASTGLEASRRRRLEKKSARRRRHATRTVPAIALVLGSATMLSYDALRPAAGAKGAGTLWEDPPSLTFGLDLSRFEAAAAAATRRASSSPHVKPAGGPEPVRVVWHHATSSGLPYAGRLSDGTQLPVQGPDWVTWNPVTDSVPNLPHRLYGNERTIRSILSVIAGYRSAHPEAPRVVVGDISLAGEAAWTSTSPTRTGWTSTSTTRGGTVS